MKSCKEYICPLSLLCSTVSVVYLCIYNRSEVNSEFNNGKHAVHRRNNLNLTVDGSGVIVNTSERDDELIVCDSINSKKRSGANFVCEFNINAMDSSETKSMTIPQFYNYDQENKKCWHRFDDTVTFFHVGKAGGGTVKRELMGNRISIEACHPKPASCINKLQKGPRTTLIINVRDPVDRFVSAFRWRVAYLLSDFRLNLAASCNPDDEGTRRACEKSKKDREEERVLVDTYRSDPNIFAEALCIDSPLRKNAMSDYSKIHHTMPLSEWLDFLIGRRMIERITDDGIQNFIAVPLVQRGSGGETLFEQHIEQLSLHLLRTRYEQGIAENILRQKPQDDGKGKKRCEHSSVRLHDKRNTSVPGSVLSPLGECCVTRHLHEDYRLIEAMIGDHAGKNKSAVVDPLVSAHPVVSEACSWGSAEQQNLCRSDLKSVLKRRAQYLDLSLGTCTNVVAKIVN